MSDISTRRFASFDGVELAVHEMGEGAPVFLLHGLFSNADTNWIKYGHAQRLADAGFRLIMPDLRAHGQSDAPHDPEAYPEDVIQRDIEALIADYGFESFDLGGFSLGARTTASLLADGTAPRRAILAGMGLEGLSGWKKRRRFFEGVIEKFDTARRGDPEWLAIQFMKTTGVDPVAMKPLLGTFSDLDAKRLKGIDRPVLVLCGTEDRDNGDPEALAAKLPQGQLTWVPGTHMSCIVKADFGEAMVRFFAA